MSTTFRRCGEKQPVVRIVDASQIELIVDIPEHLISLAPLLDTAEVRFDAFPDAELVATVKEIGAEASQTTRTYPVTLVMDQPEDLRILPGMAGRARAATLKEEIPVEQRLSRSRHGGFLCRRRQEFRLGCRQEQRNSIEARGGDRRPR